MLRLLGLRHLPAATASRERKMMRLELWAERIELISIELNGRYEIRSCCGWGCPSLDYPGAEVGFVAVIRRWVENGCSARSTKPAA
jgi:hypothetical protein